MGFVPIKCERCGVVFPALRQKRRKPRFCPDCRAIRKREWARAHYEEEKSRRNIQKQEAESAKPVNRYKNLDEHIRALKASGDTYAEDQRRQTVEKYARLNIEEGGVKQ